MSKFDFTDIAKKIGFKKKKSPKVATKLFTIVREDLPPGYQLAQTLHAGIDFIFENRKEKETKKWKRDSNTVVCLSIENEKKLFEVFKFLKMEGIRTEIFSEPDLDGEFTSLCFIERSDYGYFLDDKGFNLKLALSFKE